MKRYDFTLKFSLPHLHDDPENYVEALYQAGCDDAVVGIGKRGRIALNFMRQAKTAKAAVSTAIADVKKAIPEVTLTEASPDLVGLSDIAQLAGCSRQNIRTLFQAHSEALPPPSYEGSVALWHLAEVLPWFYKKGAYPVQETLLEVSNATLQVNLAMLMQKADPGFQKKLGTLVSLPMA